jgi:protein gp37
MSQQTNIEWCDATWPIVQGCDPVSPGCVNCYVPRVLWRLGHNPDSKISAPLKSLVEKHTNGQGDTTIRFTGEVAFRDDRLTWPLIWKKRLTIFVPSHGDIFHKAVTDEQLDKIFAVMALCPQHTFMVLTKRSARMREYLKPFCQRRSDGLGKAVIDLGYKEPLELLPWPLPNVWLGVSTEDQQRAYERIPDLLATPAAKRFVSAEPLLGPVDFNDLCDGHENVNALTGLRENPFGAVVTRRHGSKLDLVITGGESGPGARESWVPNIRSITQQCANAGVACFNKQMGAFVTDRNDAGFDGCEPGSWHLEDEGRQVVDDPYGYQDAAQGAAVRIKLRDRKGGDMSEWPEDLRVREMPR